jgi:hypothetical protein
MRESDCPSPEINRRGDMPDVSRTEVGRRIFQLKKEKSVEKAIDLIRQHLGQDWKSFSQEEIRIVQNLLGNAWVYIERSTWDSFAFSKITDRDMRALIHIGHELELKKIDEKKALNDVTAILDHLIS